METVILISIFLIMTAGFVVTDYKIKQLKGNCEELCRRIVASEVRTDFVFKNAPLYKKGDKIALKLKTAIIGGASILQNDGTYIVTDVIMEKHDRISYYGFDYRYLMTEVETGDTMSLSHDSIFAKSYSFEITKL